MMHIIDDKSADNAKTTFDLVFFYHNINAKENFFLFSERELKKSIAWNIGANSIVKDSYRQRQIGQSDCEISSNYGKTLFCTQHWHSAAVQNV